jgi:hypothetical protein
MISSLSKLLSMSFNRIQFTPDLMPSDITGTEILQENKTTGQRELRFVQGPVFANLVLADEINRTPPKTQSALLQAMQEHHVTVSGKSFALPNPFFVLGTQNPIESEGTYPLPEAQLDRFMFKISVDYPTLADEIRIATSTTSRQTVKLEPVMTEGDILRIQGRRPRRPCCRSGCVVRRPPRSGDAPQRSLELGRDPPLALLGRRSPGLSVAASRSEGAGAPRRAAERVVRRCPHRRQAGAAAPPRRQLHRRERRDLYRSGHRSDPREPPRGGLSPVASSPRR